MVGCLRLYSYLSLSLSIFFHRKVLRIVIGPSSIRPRLMPYNSSLRLRISTQHAQHIYGAMESRDSDGRGTSCELWGKWR